MELLRDKGGDDILVFAGGIIPEEDIPGLKDIGIAEVFPPGSPIQSVIDVIEKWRNGR